ncbi:MAG: hypothetical protein ACRYG7_02110 [Janthinobacterium lividum]
MIAVKGIEIGFAHAQPALQAFKQESGHPYSLLYVDIHAGAPAERNRCIRLIQLADKQFAYYDYRGQQVRRSVIADSTLGPLLVQVGQGYFMGICTNYATEPATGIWLVKRDSVTVFSLDISLHERGYFTGQDQARIDAASKLTKQLLSRKD